MALYKGDNRGSWEIGPLKEGWYPATVKEVNNPKHPHLVGMTWNEPEWENKVVWWTYSCIRRLPPGWFSKLESDGRISYYNPGTTECTWKEPAVTSGAGSPKSADSGPPRLPGKESLAPESQQASSRKAADPGVRTYVELANSLWSQHEGERGTFYCNK